MQPNTSAGSQPSQGRNVSKDNTPPLWIEDFLFLSQDTEIPERFALWCALSTLSIALGRRVWMDMGTYKIYPNLFIVLCAGSGRCRKSTAIGQVEDLIYSLKPKVNIISQKITPEALIEALQIKVVKDVGAIKTSSTGYILVDELSTFLNRKSYDAGIGSLLINLFDCKPHFEYHTKARGKEVLKDTCLGLLGGSTIEWIRAALPEDAIGGGLTSRIIFVYEKEPKPPRAWTEFTVEHEEAVVRLLKYVQVLRGVRGRVTLTEKCKEEYEREYKQFYKTSPFFESKLLGGYASRRFIHVFKIAMLIALSYKPRLVIGRRHFRTALKILAETEDNMQEVLNLIVQTEEGGLVEDVWRAVNKAGGRISRSALYRVFSHKARAREMDDVTITLVKQGRVEAITTGKDVVFKVKEQKNA